MKALISISTLILFSFVLGAQQQLEVEGKAKIAEMDKVNTADSLVVWLADSTLAIRDVSTLSEFQVLSISNDTIYLSDGGFVKLLPDLVNDADADPTNEIQSISRTGTTVTLSKSGGTFQDSVNEYTAGTGIDITNNVVGLTPVTTTGEMLYWNGTAWVSVASGNTGQILIFNGGVPTWTTAAGLTTLGTTDVYNLTTGKVWMDRNLGATQVATSSTDAASYGDLYQWGRDSDGHQIRTSGTTTTVSGTDTPGNALFILPPSDDWRSPQNDNLWQGVSGINNPCPAGYRMPTEAEWEAERVSWISNNAAGAFASPLKMPLAGIRLADDGLLLGVGSGGWYWSSTVSGNVSRNLRFIFGSSDAAMLTSGRANGLSVRCFKD